MSKWIKVTELNMIPQTTKLLLYNSLYKDEPFTGFVINGKVYDQESSMAALKPKFNPTHYCELTKP